MSSKNLSYRSRNVLYTFTYIGNKYKEFYLNLSFARKIPKNRMRHIHTHFLILLCVYGIGSCVPNTWQNSTHRMGEQKNQSSGINSCVSVKLSDFALNIGYIIGGRNALRVFFFHFLHDVYLEHHGSNIIHFGMDLSRIAFRIFFFS